MTVWMKSWGAGLAILVVGMASFAYAEPEVVDQVQRPSQLTAESQWSNKQDVELTRKIRQSIVRDKALSMDAQNVKIISMGGKVTLRGVVRSFDEERSLLDKARSLAGASQVFDQIDVIPSE